MSPRERLHAGLVSLARTIVAWSAAAVAIVAAGSAVALTIWAFASISPGAYTATVLGALGAVILILVVRAVRQHPSAVARIAVTTAGLLPVAAAAILLPAPFGLAVAATIALLWFAWRRGEPLG